MGRKFDQIKLGESSEKLHYVVNHSSNHRGQRPLSPASSSGRGRPLPHCSSSVSELMIGLTSEADHLCDDESERRQVNCVVLWQHSLDQWIKGSCEALNMPTTINLDLDHLEDKSISISISGWTETK